MVSIRSIVKAAALGMGVACVSAQTTTTSTGQTQISPSPVTSGAEIITYLFQNVAGVAILATSLSTDCQTGDVGTVNTFVSGTNQYDIDHGVLVQGGCVISATVQVPNITQLSVNYFFYTYKDTVNAVSPYDAFTLQVSNLDGLEGGIQPAGIEYSVQNLINNNTNVGPRASTTGVTILPAGQDTITITLTNYRPKLRTSGVAIAPFTVTGSMNGDPSFVGWLGQQYQVHGSANTVYNIISTPTFQFNARFDFLEAGQCRKGTECFAHPGNYFGQVGMMIKDGEQVNKIQVDAGAVNAGLTVTLNGQKLAVGDAQTVGIYTVTVISKFEVALESSEFAIVLQNSDMFLNQMLAIGSSLQTTIRQYKLAAKTSAASAESKLATLPHGILGQTWQSKTYDNRWKYIQGQLFDYIQADGIFGNSNKFNRFE